MILMDDWEKLTKQALKALQADSVMVPGAKLRAQMVEIGTAAGFDVAEHVTQSGTSFSKLIAPVNGVVVHPRVGSDVLVGLKGARLPTQTTTSSEAGSRSGGLRSDVFQAFTRVSQIPFVYLPGTDRFVPANEAQGASIEVDGQTLERLILYRQEFVKTLPQDDQQPLLDTLIHSTNPLSDFRREISARGMLAKWSSAQEETIKEKIIQWARNNNVTPRDAWFRRSQVADSAHRMLVRLVPYLTADEIRELHIPFRAVEALLADLQKG